MKIYATEDVEKFVKSLDKTVKAKTQYYYKSLSEYGHNLRMPLSKRIAPHIYELRIHGKQEIRLFYTFRNNDAIIFYGYVKDKNKIPKRVFIAINNKLKNLDR